MTLLIGCAARHRQQFLVVDPWVEATQPLRDGQVEESVSNLRPLLNDPVYACMAAFYLIILDQTKEEYLDVICSETCKHEIPGEAELLKRFLHIEEKLSQYKKRYNNQRSRVKKLREENEGLKEETEDLREEVEDMEKELGRLRFEQHKMEEIRRETEKWRIK